MDPVGGRDACQCEPALDCRSGNLQKRDWHRVLKPNTMSRLTEADVGACGSELHALMNSALSSQHLTLMGFLDVW